jgi:hypothetical protein
MRPRIAHRMYPSPCTNRPPLRSKRSTTAPVVPVIGRLVTDPRGDRAALGESWRHRHTWDAAGRGQQVGTGTDARCRETDRAG